MGKIPKMPVDINAVLEAATDIDEARQIPLFVTLFLDPDAPEDLKQCMTAAFTTTSPQAIVETRGFSRAEATVRIGCDVGVLVTNGSSVTAEMISVLRSDGVPAVVVTAAPEHVLEVVNAEQRILAPEDVIAPDPSVDGKKFPADDPLNCEPYPVTVDREEYLVHRLGEWFVATFNKKRLAFALAFPFVREPMAGIVVKLTSVQNAAIGAFPLIVGADAPLITLNQAKMVLQIAASYGLEGGTERWRELLVVCTSGFVGRAAAQQLLARTIIPKFIVQAAIPLLITQALGVASSAWFKHQSGGVYEAPEEPGRFDGVKEKAYSAWDRVRPYAAGAKAAATVLATETANTFSECASAATPKIKELAEQGAQAAAPVISELEKQATPVVMRSMGAVAPNAKATIDEFCRRQGIEPEALFSAIADTVRAQRGR